LSQTTPISSGFPFDLLSFLDELAFAWQFLGVPPFLKNVALFLDVSVPLFYRFWRARQAQALPFVFSLSYENTKLWILKEDLGK